MFVGAVPGGAVGKSPLGIGAAVSGDAVTGCDVTG